MKIDNDKNKLINDEGTKTKQNPDKDGQSFDFSRISSKKDESGKKMNVKYEIGSRGITKGELTSFETRERYTRNDGIYSEKGTNIKKNMKYGRRNNNVDGNVAEYKRIDQDRTENFNYRNNGRNGSFDRRYSVEGDNFNTKYSDRRRSNYDGNSYNNQEFSGNRNFTERKMNQNNYRDNAFGFRNRRSDNNYYNKTDDYREVHQKMESLDINKESSIYIPPHLKGVNNTHAFIPRQSFYGNKRHNSNMEGYSQYYDSYLEERYDEELFDENVYYSKYPRPENDASSLANVTCSISINPILSFNELKLPANLYERLKSIQPTPVQSYAIPAILKNRDIICRAPTGVGKTISFLVPIILKLKYRETPCLRVVIITPTRELALQIQIELDKLISQKGNKDEALNILDNSYLKSYSLYGGTDVYAAKQKIRSGCDILIATPGRLCDFIEKELVSLKNVKFFVLDEADRMLEMGFEREMKYIRRSLNDPLTYMFSATFEKKVKQAAEAQLRKDKISIEYELETLKNITQEFIYEDRPKLDIIHEIIRSNENDRILIFVEKKITCKNLERALSRTFDCVSLHGDKCQMEREAALSKFKTGKCNILVATSVAARGLDIPLINLVVNYDLPRSIKEYIHRIGRSGRCGKMGWSISIYNDMKDDGLRQDLVGVLVESDNRIPKFLKR